MCLAFSDPASCAVSPTSGTSTLHAGKGTPATSKAYAPQPSVLTFPPQAHRPCTCERDRWQRHHGHQQSPPCLNIFPYLLCCLPHHRRQTNSAQDQGSASQAVSRIHIPRLLCCLPHPMQIDLALHRAKALLARLSLVDLYPASCAASALPGE